MPVRNRAARKIAAIDRRHAAAVAVAEADAIDAQRAELEAGFRR